MSLNKVIVWVNPDNTIRITSLFKSGMLKNESEDEYISRIIQRLRKNPTLKDLKHYIKTKQDIKQAMTGNSKRKLVVNPSGVISTNPDIVTPQEKRDIVRQSLIEKIKQTIPSIQDDEIDFSL